ncbi:MAG: periplasmic protein thiol:disulfide oxidoreductase, DsbE subfamily [Phenylobacterium sp.]|nr:periplasmic protein thiol:disulfide oxidoreductase, DsbE subfamily [Phenylobacterium sp.]
MKRLLAIAPIMVFALVLVGFMVGLRRDPSILPSMLIGKPVPAFALPPLRAGDVGLASAELKGEPMLLNVFASWCGACRVEHPTLMRLSDEGVIIHGLDWKDEPADGAAWLAQYGDPYRRAGNDRTGRAGIDLGVSGAPETFVVDRRGHVRYRQVGAITPKVWNETLGPLMAKLRAEP